MHPYQNLASATLNDAGLNCHAVFDIAALPPALRAQLFESCPPAAGFKQLILIGHGGRTFWQALQASGRELVRNEVDHPVDDFTVATVQEFLHTEFAGVGYEIVYPGSYTVGLQALGQLAGWHHPSPFMVGINASFGSWFAYRALVLANTDLPVSTPVASDSPCASCSAQPCVRKCPAQALDGGQFHLQKCLSYRRQAGSACKKTCIARVSCPVAGEHRYTTEQMHYHYGRSMKVIDALGTD